MVAIGPLHWAVFRDFASRTALVNLVLAVQMSWTAWVLLRPRSRTVDWRWRWLAGTGLLTAAALVMARIGLVLFARDAYPTFEGAHWVNTVGLIVSNANLVVGTLAFLLAHRDEAEQELQRLATTDGLTGVMNRRHWMDAAGVQLRLAERHPQPVTAVMLDLDHFKRVNDTHGHAAGDRALQLFATGLRQAVRAPDLVGRYGGEEFCLLLPHSEVSAAQAIDARLRAWLAATSAAQLGFALTCSAGAAAWQPGVSLERLMWAADEALYRAKDLGRDQLAVAVTPGADRTPPTIG